MDAEGARPAAAMAPSPRWCQGWGHGEGAGAVGTGRAGCWVVPGPAWEPPGPVEAPGTPSGASLPGLSRCRSPSVGSSATLPGCPRCGTGVTPAGPHRPWGPCRPSATPIRAGPEPWIRLRLLPASGGGGEAGAAARWSRLCTAIFLGGEGWGEMDALTCGGATAGNVTEGRRAAAAGAEPVPVPIPVPVLVPGPGPWSSSSLVGPSPGHPSVTG